MKIICVEEHTIDAELGMATRDSVAAEAPYLKDWGSRVADKHPALIPERPYLIPTDEFLALGQDVGAGRIANMDREGIDMQILSYSGSPQLGAPEQAVDLSRRLNDRMAAAVAANPSRFCGFATLPWQHPDAAADELERAVKTLGLKGTLLTGRPGNTFLDDARYEPVLAKLNELEVPIYIHPGYPLPQVQQAYYGGLDKEVGARLSLFGWGWHNEAGVQLIRLLLSRKFDKYPRLRAISGHWGEMVPFYLQRLDDTIPPEAHGLGLSITETYRKHVYVTPSGMFDSAHFDFIYKVMGADRIIYSIDYPYLSLRGARSFLEGLPISQTDKEKIAFRNAEALFRL